NLAEPLAQHARARPDKPALVHGEHVVSYRELNDLVDRSAAHLLDRGVRAGDVVALSLADTIEHVVLLFALARAGVVMLPLDWRWNAAEQERVGRHFGAKLILTEFNAAPVCDVPCMPVDDAWHAAVANSDSSRSWPVGDGPLLMSLSSGTTGRPKGPRLTHYQFLRRFWVQWINLGFNSQDRFISATPLYFGGGRTYVMLMLYSGATVFLFPPPYELPALVAAIARSRASVVFLVPTLLRRLLALTDAELAPLRAMRLVFSSGSALHTEERLEIRARICPRFIEYYSSTEGGGVSFLTADEMDAHGDSVGRPVFAVDVECVDELHRPLPAGEVGRIRYRGPAVADGLWNDPEASREAFRDGWYYPGDLGMLDAAGYLHLRGRAKDMIIRGGINIYPADVEAVLQSHPAVTESAVVGWPSREFNEEVAAFVIARAAVTAAELRDHCKPRLASYKVPRDVFIVTELPRNTLGKIVKTELVARLPQL
ncbi:MAG: AMP-binding protein, partial [Burkholderiales bacterium]